jgi:hypothetical protein
MKQERKDVLIALVSILFSLVVLTAVIPRQIIMPKVVFGTPPDLLPRATCWLMIAMSAVMLANCIRKDPNALKTAFPDFVSQVLRNRAQQVIFKNVLITMGICVGYYFLFKYAGFFIASVLIIPAMALLFGWRRHLVLALTTVGVCLAIYYSFALLMKIYLPGWVPLGLY